MDKLPAGIRAKFLKKQAATAKSESASTSGSSTPLQSGAESQLPSPLRGSSSPEIPFPLARLEECLACNAPCTDEEQVSYPSYISKSIDRESPLAGSVKPYGRHILISTGRTNWIHSIDEEEGSVAQGIFKGLYDPKLGGPVKNKREGYERVVLSNTSFAPRRIGSGKTEVVIMPEWKLVTNVTNDSAGEFVKHHIDGLPLEAEEKEKRMMGEILPFHSVVLICSHGKRDKRCGVTSKYLLKAFESGLRRRNIYRSFDDQRSESEGGLPGGGTALGCLSHIGGHKFAGNVIIYRRRTKSVQELHSKLEKLTLTTVENPEDADTIRGESNVTDVEGVQAGEGLKEGGGARDAEVQAEGIWLGRVEPKHVEAIIEEVILKGRVFKELYRGGLPSKFASLQF